MNWRAKGGGPSALSTAPVRHTATAAYTAHYTTGTVAYPAKHEKEQGIIGYGYKATG